MIVETSYPAPSAVAEPTTAAAALAEERRRSERVEQQMPGWISGESNDRSSRGRSVTVCDLSMHGVGFHDAIQRYRPGAAHWLVVNGGQMRMSTRVRIVSCRENPAGGYDVGGQFF